MVNLSNNLQRGTALKAFEKSKIARYVCSFLSNVFIISFIVL